MGNTPNLTCHRIGITELAGWSHQRVLFEVRERGTTLSALSLSRGYARNTLHCALDRRPHPRANSIIADFLGVSRHEIWPAWFDADDRPRQLPADPEQRAAIDPYSPCVPLNPRNQEKSC